MTNSQLKQALALIQYLIANADKKGLTHGEKHHYLAVALMVLANITIHVGSLTLRWDDDSVPTVDEIPF